MSYTVDYDKFYKEDLAACGKPFKEFEIFFKKNIQEAMSVLDLGCGQGRDAILVAKMGAHVVGVDVSTVGLKQLNRIAKKEKLKIETIVSDLVDFKTRKRFDVIILDRVLHIVATEHEREQVLEKSITYLRKSGYILIADTPLNIISFRKYLKKNNSQLKYVLDNKNYLFVQKWLYILKT